MKNSVFSETEFFLSGNIFLSDSTVYSMINTDNYESSFEHIIKLYNNNGFPFVKILIDSIISIGNKQKIFITINEGKLFFIGNIDNNGEIKNEFLNNVLNIKNRVFSDSLILSRLTLLKNYDFLIPNTDYYPYIYNDSIVNIKTFINRKKISNINAAVLIGLDTFNIQGFININLISPAGYGRVYQLNYYKYGKYENTLNLNVNFPFLFRTPFGINLNIRYNSRDSIYSDANATFNIIMDKIFYKLYMGVSRTWEFYSYYSDSNKVYNSINSGFEIKYRILNVKLNYKHNFYNNVFYRLSEEITINPVFYNNLFTNRFYYSKLFSDILTNGMLIVLGGNTIKGFQNNFIYIRDKFEYSFLYDYKFSDMFFSGLFFDFALFSKTIEQSILSNYIYSYGPHLKYKTDNMILDLFYAIPLNKYFNGRIHLNFEYLF